MTMTQSHPGNILRSGSETFLRVLFGVFLAVIAVALVLYSAQWFAAVTLGCACLSVIRCPGPSREGR